MSARASVRVVLGAAWMLAACGNARAQTPIYVPAQVQSGTIRSWGDDAMAGTMKAWEDGFRKYHPEIKFEDTLLGTATGMAGIITGTSDLSLMGRPATVNELIGFEWVFRVKPLGIQVMSGGLRGEGKSPALAVFVSRENPVRQISITQLAEMLGCPVNLNRRVTWGIVGAKGAWQDRPVHAFVYDDQTGTGAFLQRAVQGVKDCWNWDLVREFREEKSINGPVVPAAQQIVDALRRDPDGLAVATLEYAGPEVRPVSVDGLALTRANVVEGRYPLRRGVYIYLNREKGKPVDAKVAEFLRFVLSREGQALVDVRGDYLPLNAVEVGDQLEKLE